MAKAPAKTVTTSTALVTAWSYSRFNDYETCPLLFKLKHIDRRPTAGSPAMARGNEVHSIAENYVQIDPKVKVALPEELKGVATEANYLRAQDAHVEQAWGFRGDWSWIGRPGWFGNDVWFRAKADAVVVYDDNTALLIDWKTGKKYETNEDQVRLFALAATKRFPTLREVDTRLWYVDADPADNEVQRVFAATDMPAIQRDWERKVRPMFADRKFAPKPGPKCRYCDFSRDRGGPCKF